MQIIYEPIWGSQERWDLGIVRPSLKCDPSEEPTALQQGWLIYNQHWYLSRSVRVRTSLLCEEIDKFQHEIVDIPNKDELESIWYGYLERKHLPEYYKLWADEDRTKWLLLRDQAGALVSFTKLVQYHGSWESAVNAYAALKGISIGKRMLELEISLAYLNEHEFLYIGAGYERGSTYKADVPGFEFWNGESWDIDRIKYKQMCSRDSEINTLSQLNELWNSR